MSGNSIHDPLLAPVTNAVMVPVSGLQDGGPIINPGDALLLESGDYLLLESGDKLLLE